MLSYSFSVLNEQGYKSIATEKFDNIAELMAAILVKGIATQLKRGLQKEYIGRTEEHSLLVFSEWIDEQNFKINSAFAFKVRHFGKKKKRTKKTYGIFCRC